MSCCAYVAVNVLEQYIGLLGLSSNSAAITRPRRTTASPREPSARCPPQDDFELQMPTLDEMSNKHGQEAVWLDLAGMGLPPVGAVPCGAVRCSGMSAPERMGNCPAYMA